MSDPDRTAQELLRENEALRQRIADLAGPGSAGSGEQQASFLAKVVDQSPWAIAVVRKDGRIEYANPALLAQYGKSEAEVVGRSWQEWMPPTSPIWKIRQHARAAVYGSQTGWGGEIVEDQPDGSFTPRYVEVSPVVEGGVATHLVYYSRDIGDVVAARAALQTSELRYRTLFESVDEAIFIMREGRFIDCNPAALSMFALDRQAFIEASPLDVSPPSQPDGRPSATAARDYIQAAYNGVPQTFAWTHQRSDGTPFDAEVSLTRMILPGEVLLLALVRDVTERRAAERRLAAYQHDLRMLTHELVRVEERERRRIATGLHDSASQTLAAAGLHLSALQEGLDSDVHRQSIDTVLGLLQSTATELRTLSLDLSPPILYELGLEPALEAYTQRFGQNAGIETTFTCRGRRPALSVEVSALLYRCATELLANVLKHAQASRVEVTVTFRPGRVLVGVEDDGIGFRVGQVGSRRAPSGGYGLFSIRQRLEVSGGHLLIEASPNGGTRALMRLPLPQGTTAV